MEEKLTEDRAILIANAIRNDGTFCGSPSWLEDHNIGFDEFDAFLESAAELARAREFRTANPNVGAVEAEMVFTTHNGKVGTDDEKWTVYIPHKYTNKVLSVAEHGKVTAVLMPSELAIETQGAQMQLPFDAVTGEILE